MHADELEDPALPETRKFCVTLEQFELAQHVAEPSERRGNCLDVRMTCDDLLIAGLSSGLSAG